jgi:hypothetical protein
MTSDHNRQAISGCANRSVIAAIGRYSVNHDRTADEPPSETAWWPVDETIGRYRQ